ncbi:MAG: DUF2254 domain-containing protein [Gammaproteobacteria bacterium]
MMSKWKYLLSRLNRRLWVRAGLYALIGIASALVSALAGPYLDLGPASWLGANAVKDLLTIMASSMLAVATFSLSTMVSAYAAASSGTTPRATRLWIEDPTAQTALSTFIGAFLFSIVGLIALSTGIYQDEGRVLLFVITVVVIGIVVATLLNWIDRLSSFGRSGETIDRVEAATRQALQERLQQPFLGGTPCARIPDGSRPVAATEIGHVRAVDMGRLHAAAEAAGITVYLAALPGAFVDPARPPLYVAGECDEACAAKLLSAVIMGDSRTFEQDPRFGLIVLAEIASRALSPAVNDPGTAIDIIGTGLRLLSLWPMQQAADTAEIRYPRIHVPPLHLDDLLHDLYGPIARDGAGILEVGVKLQRAFGALEAIGHPDLARAAQQHARLALQRAEAALDFEPDRVLLRAAATRRRREP